MKEVVPDVHLLSQFPRQYLNAYLVGDVLVDAGTRQWGTDLVETLRGHEVRAHALTHALPDHQGTSALVCKTFDVPLWCHERERDAAATGHTAAPMPEDRFNRLLESVSAGPGYPVERTLSEGEELAGFEVVETPGNAPGHVSLWRESDGTVVLGDVLANRDLWTLRRGLTTLPERFTWDPAAAVRSARRVADLEPDTVLFGHGPPLRDGPAFQEFVATLDE